MKIYEWVSEVPALATMALFALGIAVLSVVPWRRRKAVKGL